MFDTMWSKVPGLVNTLDNEGEMDRLLASTDESVNFSSVLVPTLSWDAATDKEILTRPASTWVEGCSGLMSRQGEHKQNKRAILSKTVSSGYFQTLPDSFSVWRRVLRSGAGEEWPSPPDTQGWRRRRDSSG